MTLKSLKTFAEFGVLFGVGYIAFRLTVEPIRWALRKLREWKRL